MTDVVYVNEEEGKRRIMNNAKLYAKLLVKFKEGTNLDELIASATAGDWEKAQAAAHTVKGVAANLSLTELYKQSREVETQLKTGSITLESLENLKTCFSATVAAVDMVIAQNV